MLYLSTLERNKVIQNMQRHMIVGKLRDTRTIIHQAAQLRHGTQQLVNYGNTLYEQC